MISWLLRFIFVRILGRWALGLMALWGLVKVLRGSDERVQAEAGTTGSPRTRRSRSRTRR